MPANKSQKGKPQVINAERRGHLSAPAKPDWTFWLVRYQVRAPRGADRDWVWTDTGRLNEHDALSLFKKWTKGYKPGDNLRNFQLVRSEEYVVAEPEVYQRGA